jgi:hypothetical protein
MLRRLLALVLAVTCAFAPVAQAFEVGATEAESCCCGSTCACPPTDCAPAPAAPTTVRAPVASTEQRALAARPRIRVATAAFARFLSAPMPEPALTARTRAPHAEGPAPADSVALYEAHCSYRI